MPDSRKQTLPIITAAKRRRVSVKSNSGTGRATLLSVAANARKDAGNRKSTPLKSRISHGDDNKPRNNKRGGSSLESFVTAAQMASLAWPVSRNLELAEGINNRSVNLVSKSSSLLPLIKRLTKSEAEEDFKKSRWLRKWTEDFLKGLKSKGSSLLDNISNFFGGIPGIGKLLKGAGGLALGAGGLAARGLGAGGRMAMNLGRFAMANPMLAPIAIGAYGMTQSWNDKSGAGYFGRAASGAAMGAGIGSFIPIIGTGIGAAIGAVLGAFGPQLVSAVSSGWDYAKQGLSPIFNQLGEGLSWLAGIFTKTMGMILPDWMSLDGAVIKQLKQSVGYVIKSVLWPITMTLSLFTNVNAMMEGNSVDKNIISVVGAAPEQLYQGNLKTVSGQARSYVDSGLGSVSARYESRGDAKAVNRDNNNKWAYGKYQINTGGTMAHFIKWLKENDPVAAKQLEEAGGQTAANRGDPRFAAKWRELVDSRKLSEAQHQFISDTHYTPLVNKVKSDIGLDLTRSRALQEMTWSVGVQHGGNSELIGKALKGKDVSKLSDEQIIEAVYAERRKSGYWTKSSAKQRAGLATRFANEQAQLTQIAQSGNGNKSIALNGKNNALPQEVVAPSTVGNMSAIAPVTSARATSGTVVAQAKPIPPSVTRATLAQRRPDTVVEQSQIAAAPAKTGGSKFMGSFATLDSVPIISQNVNLALVLGGHTG